MPYSANIFNKEIVDFLGNHPFNKVLDIGAGAGKYVGLIKEVNGSANIIAIEPDNVYIEDFSLKEKYTDVWNMPIESYLTINPFTNYDIVIFGDVIEHLPKSQGIDVLNRLMYHSKYIICVFPIAYLQDDWEGHKQEAHISVWNKKDFAYFDPIIYKENDGIGLAIIRGFLP